MPTAHGAADYVITLDEICAEIKGRSCWRRLALDLQMFVVSFFRTATETASAAQHVQLRLWTADLCGGLGQHEGEKTRLSHAYIVDQLLDDFFQFRPGVVVHLDLRLGVELRP